MRRRLGFFAALVMITGALSGCIYVGGGRHYHEGEDDYYGRDDGYRGRDHRYDDRSDSRYDNRRQDTDHQETRR